MSNLWDYRPSVLDYRESTWTLDRDLVGYDVEATDGRIGTIHRAVSDPSGAYVVVEAGSWLPGAKRLIPAAVIAELDHPGRTVRVELTLHKIREAPDYHPDRWDDDARSQHCGYYGS